MCGIFGTSPFSEPELAKAQHALHTLEHRGPDQWNDWHNQNVYLGHRRLSILDLSEQGRQPMVSEDGEVAIIVNGEIYNYLQLRQQLEPKYKFRSNSDSEVVLHGYREWGITELLRRLDGMYAFAIYDGARKSVVLARDRVGIKPLYYYLHQGRLVWASELKAIVDFVGKDNLTTDYTAIYDFLTYLYVPTPKTMYQNTFKLPAAHYAVFDIQSGAIELNQYWQLDVKVQANIDKDAAANLLQTHIKRAVKEQLMSDVPLGFFVSGGLDSSVVVAAATASTNPKTFAIGFNEATHDERGFAQTVADHFQTEHYDQVLTLAETQTGFANLRTWYDEPFGDTSAFPTAMVSKFTRENCTVALSGDGGDELFGGYTRYAEFQETGNIDQDLALFAQTMAALPPELKQKYATAWGIPAHYDDYWYFRKHYRPELPLRTRLQYLDFHTYLPDDILTKVDRASMRVALEVRVPLLDTQLIEFAFSLPEELRYYQGELKGLLKYAYRHLLPPEILQRNKKGFSIPTGQWKSELFPGIKYVQQAIITNLYPELT